METQGTERRKRTRRLFRRFARKAFGNTDFGQIYGRASAHRTAKALFLASSTLRELWVCVGLGHSGLALDLIAPCDAKQQADYPTAKMGAIGGDGRPEKHFAKREE